MQIKYINKTPEAQEYNKLTDRVGCSIKCMQINMNREKIGGVL